MCERTKNQHYDLKKKITTTIEGFININTSPESGSRFFINLESLHSGEGIKLEASTVHNLDQIFTG